MERQLGQVYMVNWQGRRIAPEQRAKGRIARLVLSLAVISAVSLMVGFYSGLPVPIGLLQTVFAFLAVVVAVYAARAGLDALMHHGERARVSGRRR